MALTGGRLFGGRLPASWLASFSGGVMGYGKERPCKKCSTVKLILARGLCSSCFAEVKKAGKLDDYPTAIKRTSVESKFAEWWRDPTGAYGGRPFPSSGVELRNWCLAAFVAGLKS